MVECFWWIFSSIFFSNFQYEFSHPISYFLRLHVQQRGCQVANIGHCTIFNNSSSSPFWIDVHSPCSCSSSLLRNSYYSMLVFNFICYGQCPFAIATFCCHFSCQFKNFPELLFVSWIIQDALPWRIFLCSNHYPIVKAITKSVIEHLWVNHVVIKHSGRSQDNLIQLGEWCSN